MYRPLKVEESTILVVGSRPAGLCAILCPLSYRLYRLFTVCSVSSPLVLATKLGAEPLNFAADSGGMVGRINQETEDRGADVPIEVVGLAPALSTAFDLVQPFSVISSIRVHNSQV
jgi:threonine dehydrogenase-like Zn-dependent dehydrogenase